VVGNTTLTGNATLSGTLQTIAGNTNFDSGVLFVDATNNRVGINNTAPGVALRLTGDIDVSATANVQGNANVGGTFGVAGNTTLTSNATLNGTLQTIAGNVNFDTGTLFVDATNNRVGINNTAPGVALRVTGATDISLTANIQGNANVGGTFGVAGVTTLTGNATLNGTLQTIAGNVNIDSGVLFVDATNDRIGINNTAPGVALRVTGAADISLTANVQGAANVGGAFGVAGNTTLTGNAVLSGTLQTIAGNTNFTSGVLFVDATNNRVGINNTAPGVALRVTGAADISLTANIQGNANVGGTFGVAGVTTLTGNATLNGTLQTIAGNVNIDSGVLFVDAGNDRVGINNSAPTVALHVTGAANISTSVNSALLTVGANLIANSSVLYHTGNINASSFTTTGLVANTSAIVPTSNSILLGNSVGRFILSANTGNFSGNVVISGTANVSQTLNVTGNVTINTFATFLTFANTDLGSNTTADITAISFPKANHRAGELLIYISSGSEHQITKILFAHNGTDVNQTIYGTIVAPSSSSPLANNIIMTVNSTNIDVNLRQRVSNSSVKILTNMII
jgi:hypothetical protein